MANFKFSTLAVTSIGLHWQWTALVALTLVLAVVLALAGLPGALLLGAMVSGLVLALNGATIGVPGVVFRGAQAIVGCLVARSITGSILVSIAHDWPVMLAVVVTTVMASALVGWLLVRFEILPGSTAAWGSSPGAASVMVVMAEEFGADPRLVAFMQYLRVLCIAFVAALLTRLWLGSTASPPRLMALAEVGPLLPLAETLAFAVGGAWVGVALRIPAGAVMVPMAIGAVLHATGLLDITLPPWLLGVAYFIIGWSIGLRFDREVSVRALRAVPAMLLAVAAVMGLCGLCALVLVLVVGTDPLTAYLATSPGGLDTMAIIATGSSADVPFVLALQTLRLILVIASGPPLARLIVRMSRKP